MKLSSLQKQLLGVALATGLLLLIPAIAMRFTQEVSWGPFDFAAAALLLFTTGAVAVLGARRLPERRQRLGLFLLAGTVLLVVWAELAVGLFH